MLIDVLKSRFKAMREPMTQEQLTNLFKHSGNVALKMNNPKDLKNAEIVSVSELILSHELLREELATLKLATGRV